MSDSTIESFYNENDLVFLDAEPDEIERFCIEKDYIKSDALFIRSGLFNNSALEHVSAILFSATTTLGKRTALANSDRDSGQINHVVNVRQISHEPSYSIKSVSPIEPEDLSDGLFLFHNPFARNMVDRRTFNESNIIQIYLEGDQFRFEGKKPPLFSRYNDIVKLPEEFLSKIVKAFNRVC